ncbi:MAG: C1 family peptidase [Sphaerospermopsis sp.]|nr:C1 family peptidase [Sphaerospermopsis sp.]
MRISIEINFTKEDKEMPETPDFSTGWIIDATDDRDYFLETVISKLPPQEIETEGKNIKLERALFAQDDDSPILRRALRLVPEEEWRAKRYRYNQPHYLFLPLAKKKKYKKYRASLESKDLFLPESVDLRRWFSPIKNQGNVQSCTACAGVALMEYFQNRMNGSVNNNSDAKDKNDSAEPKQENLSWMFLYKATKEVMRLTKNNEDPKEDKGATIRDTLKAMRLFGVAPEKCWNSSMKNLNDEPSAFCYAYAQNYQATHYFRLDKSELSKEEIVVQIRIALSSGLPAIFGFRHAEILKNNITNLVKRKLENTKILGQIDVVKSNNSETKEGHALVAVGYDDNMEFENPEHPEQPLKGAFLVRNSWGIDNWGDKGYAWLPYYYIEQGLATDWWSLLNAEWIDFRGFGLEVDISGSGLLKERQCCNCCGLGLRLCGCKGVIRCC